MNIIFKTSTPNHRSWTSRMQRLDYARILHEVINHVKLTYEILDISYDETNNCGLIYAGDKIAGTFIVDREIQISSSY